MISVLDNFCQILFFLIIIRSLSTWFPNSARTNPIIRLVYYITDPLIVPLSRVVPRLGMIDLTPMIAAIILIALQRLLRSIA
ncbi:MAG: YggT family protein [SAR202 cluster bacterium]|nr:hypothetical protein [Chloroflexota bacterium]MQG47779.1 YggT family protein [SAR202 cluster bacterium]